MKKMWEYFWKKGSKYIVFSIILSIIRNSNYPNDYYTITVPELLVFTVGTIIIVTLTWLFEKFKQK
ncbi:MAG: hypothetical protein BGO41_01310 [Clostridiales bacterium 38-18]|nr:MAG: hypothetical protein BGO41_01310 [Clostridiales bacterium 38-18]